MKGQLSWPIILLLITITLTIGILVPIKFLKTPLNYVVKYSEKYDQSQMILISLLSSTENGKTIQQLIGEHIIYGKPQEKEIQEILKYKMDNLTENGCYKLLTSDNKILVKSSCDASEYKQITYIPLPYNENKITEKITLVID